MTQSNDDAVRVALAIAAKLLEDRADGYAGRLSDAIFNGRLMAEELRSNAAAIRALAPPKAEDVGEPFAWCQPMDCGKHTPRKFMIYFEDPDHGIMVFDNEAEARAAFEKKNTAWNCYLFGTLPLYAALPAEAHDGTAGEERWPTKGDMMTFLGKNGYPAELQAALKIFNIGQQYRIEDCNVQNWSHSVRFAGIDGWHNGVMFERLASQSPSARGDG